MKPSILISTITAFSFILVTLCKAHKPGPPGPPGPPKPGVPARLTEEINERISNILTIGSCNAIDILRYNDIFQRFADLQSLASKGRLNGRNPDSVAIANYVNFIEETMVSDFRFEFYYTDRNIASTPIGPILYSSRDAYLYGDQTLQILSWIASTDLHSGTMNINGGQFGYVNCEYSANTATLFSRTVDFITGERGEFDAMGRILGNLDQNENGRIDNKLGLVRFETTFNGYKIAAMKVEAETYGTIEVNSFQDTAFPSKTNTATQQIVKSQISDGIIIGNSTLNSYLLIIIVLIITIANGIMFWKKLHQSKEIKCDSFD